mmetsp:Transcript_5145/g.14447  ORF Transcript_5145/g.14447 Transcript_5145/m.14447 type:complete len:260 (+) Transcript_5145:1639-2418(+)
MSADTASSAARCSAPCGATRENTRLCSSSRALFVMARLRRSAERITACRICGRYCAQSSRCSTQTLASIASAKCALEKGSWYCTGGRISESSHDSGLGGCPRFTFSSPSERTPTEARCETRCPTARAALARATYSAACLQYGRQSRLCTITAKSMRKSRTGWTLASLRPTSTHIRSTTSGRSAPCFIVSTSSASSTRRTSAADPTRSRLSAHGAKYVTRRRCPDGSSIGSRPIISSSRGVVSSGRSAASRSEKCMTWRA